MKKTNKIPYRRFLQIVGVRGPRCASSYVREGDQSVLRLLYNPNLKLTLIERDVEQT
jgi:hypothetical protein